MFAEQSVSFFFWQQGGNKSFRDSSLLWPVLGRFFEKTEYYSLRGLKTKNLHVLNVPSSSTHERALQPIFCKLQSNQPPFLMCRLLRSFPSPGPRGKEEFHMPEPGLSGGRLVPNFFSSETPSSSNSMEFQKACLSFRRPYNGLDFISTPQ